MRRREELLGQSRVFCMLPWTHLNVAPNGEVRPCCQQGAVVGDARRQSLQQIWNSPGMRSLRLSMLEGRATADCSCCYELEATSAALSFRRWANRQFAGRFEKVAATAADGSAGDVDLPYIEVRFSNLCNFRCRICSPRYSSSWFLEGKTLGTAESGSALVTAGDIWPQLEPLIPGLEWINFAGGEPLIMDDHYRLLNLLLERKMTRVQLTYATNFSTMIHGGQDVMKLWDRFENVRIMASLDGMGRRGEYLRTGQDWEEVVRNRRRMLEACPRAEFLIFPTLTAMNALHLPDLHRDWLEKGLIRLEDGIHINILNDPPEYCVQILPPHLKRRVAVRYREHIEGFLKPLGPGHEAAAAIFRGAVNYIEARDRTDLLPRFRDLTNRLDAMRSERFAEVFPELAELMG